MASARTMLLTLRLILKGEDLEQASQKAQGSIKQLDQAVETSNAKQAKGQTQVQDATRMTSRQYLDLVQQYKDGGMTAEAAVKRVNTELKTQAKTAKTTADDVKKLGDVSVDGGKKAAGGFAEFGNKLKDIGKGLAAGAIAAGVSAIAAAVAKLVADSNKAYQDLQASTRGVQATFGEASAAIEAYARNSAMRLGESTTSYQKMAVEVGRALKETGVPMNDLARSTDEVITRSNDLAAFWGTSTQEALKAYTSALSGNRDALKDYNVDLSDAALKQFAVQNGLTGLSDSALIYQKILADTGAQQGFFGDKANETSAKQKMLNARWEEAKAQLGEKLQPALIGMMNYMIAAMTVIDQIIQVFGAMAQGIGFVIDAIKSMIDWLNKIPGAGILSPILNFFKSDRSADLTYGAKVAYAFGVPSARDGRAAAVPSSVNILRPHFNLNVSIDGQQLQGRISDTVQRAMAYDGARLMAGGWY